MTQGEYVTLAIAVGIGLVLISAIASFVSDRTIGWKLLVIEVLATAAIAAGCFYFMPSHDEKVLRERYRDKVVTEIEKCQRRCFDMCMGRKARKDD